MRKFLITSVTLVLLSGLGWGACEAATVQVQPTHAIFVGTDQQTVDFVVADAPDLLGVSLTIQFDPAVVTPVSAYPGEVLNQATCPAFFSWVNDDDFVDTIVLDMALLGCTENAAGALFSIDFEGVASGTTDLAMIDLQLRDGSNDPIPVEGINGSLTYYEGVLANLRFQPENVLFEEDGTCEICLNLENVDDFLGMSVNFQFDPTILLPVSVEAGPALSAAGCPFYLDWLNQGSVDGTVGVDVALLGCHVPMDGDVICITFQGQSYGTTSLDWLNVQVRDGENNPVPVNLFGGEVLYDPVVWVEPVEMGDLKARYR